MFKRPISNSSQRKCWGPLLITIAPICSGKSSFLWSLEETIEAVSPQNEPYAYQKMELQIMIKYSPESEMKLLALLFCNVINISEFRKRLCDITNDVILREELISAAAQLIATGKHYLEAKMVYKYEANASAMAVAAAQKLLKKAMKSSSSVICWDTALINANSSDSIKQALAMAEKYNRAVRFIRWSHEIPVVSFRELLKRNILRFLSTGHYWEAGCILSSYRNAEKLSLLQEKEAVPSNSKELRMTHAALAQYHNFRMTEHGFVFHYVEPPDQQQQLHTLVESNQPMVKRHSLRMLFSSTQSLSPLVAADAVDKNGNGWLSSNPWAEWFGTNTTIHRRESKGTNAEQVAHNPHWRTLRGLSSDSASLDLADLQALSMSLDQSICAISSSHDELEHKQGEVDTPSLLLSPSSEPSSPASCVRKQEPLVPIRPESLGSSPFPFLVDAEGNAHKVLQMYMDSPGNSTKTNYSERKANPIDVPSVEHEPCQEAIVSNVPHTTELDSQYRVHMHVDPTVASPLFATTQSQAIQRPLLTLEHPDTLHEDMEHKPLSYKSFMKRIFCCGC